MFIFRFCCGQFVQKFAVSRARVRLAVLVFRAGGRHLQGTSRGLSFGRPAARDAGRRFITRALTHHMRDTDRQARGAAFRPVEGWTDRGPSQARSSPAAAPPPLGVGRASRQVLRPRSPGHASAWSTTPRHTEPIPCLLLPRLIRLRRRRLPLHPTGTCTAGSAGSGPATSRPCV